AMPPAYARPATDVPRHLQKADGDIEALFDRVAPRYDLLNRLLSFSMDVAWRRLLVEAAGPIDQGQILDCATGTGDVLFEFLRQLPVTVHGMGIDFSQEMLVRAQAKANRLAYQDRATFRKANLLDLPFPDGQFEAVSIAFGIRNVSDTARGLAEMARVCRPGGRVLVLEFMRQPKTSLRRMTDLYCNHGMPLLAKALAPDAAAYRYLSASVEQFLSPGELVGLMERAGLEDCRATNLFLGIATLHAGTKPLALGSASLRSGRSPSEEMLS
ncbi:MAG TPA: bifunctional demethylmenaquinone methyltransferase/2-methoxy-6-polyprenyl-1,4-benzoquinol methylase UbiE, partial [bacterium]|nr:bifunctional demethylmenaquinone methyltransferase/2-methoxy-6-polyprenyl-1,4-benzoquinol methylase UbiE [bacterium]